MDINDPPSSHYESGQQTGTSPYSYDLRNPFYHLTNMTGTTPVRRLSLLSFASLVLAAGFILFVMIQVG